MTEQASIFNVLPDTGNYEKLRLKALKSKRIRYKNPTHTKFYKEDEYTDGTRTDSIEKWGNMNRLYFELANWFPYPLAFDNCQNIIRVDDDTSFVDIGMIRTYKVCYHKEKYKHRGDDGVIKEFKGEEFFSNYAEVIDTEDLGINERLFIHYWLVNYLEEGYKIEQLNMWIDELINMMLNGFTAELLIVLLLNLRCKDVNI